MKTVDLAQRQLTVDELLQSAVGETVLILTPDGSEFVLEAADAFDREVAEFAASEKFMSFLAERAKEKGSVSLEEIERRLNR